MVLFKNYVVQTFILCFGCNIIFVRHFGEFWRHTNVSRHPAWETLLYTIEVVWHRIKIQYKPHMEFRPKYSQTCV